MASLTLGDSPFSPYLFLSCAIKMASEPEGWEWGVEYKNSYTLGGTKYFLSIILAVGWRDAWVCQSNFIGSRMASFNGRAMHDGPEVTKISNKPWEDSEISSGFMLTVWATLCMSSWCAL